MKKQIQSYIPEKEYKALKKLSEKKGLSFATFVRVVLLDHLQKEQACQTTK